MSAAGASGAEAAFLNPASLARFTPESPSEAALEYAALLESAYSGSAAYARPLGAAGAFGAGLVYASQGAQTRYSPVGDATGKFTPSDLALAGWYARRLGGTFAVGGGFKLIRSSLDDRSGTTAALDFGLTAKHVADLGDGELDVGASLSNIGPPLKLGSESDPLPARLRGGAVWRVSPRSTRGSTSICPSTPTPTSRWASKAASPRRRPARRSRGPSPCAAATTRTARAASRASPASPPVPASTSPPCASTTPGSPSGISVRRTASRSRSGSNVRGCQA
ncbi:MAG: PorV/PorQ family protein [Elusimicrobiota bacterium]|nr:MAG: PorV/PorQ family protein [Elusimicrobiota bacterium]